ncbi:MAG: MFS transporter [Desulfobacterium sp.]|nr:MFS transporter [Desulfobacterium sp.]
MAYLFVYFHRLSLSVVADELIAEFHTSASIMGMLGSVYFYCYAAMQLPAGLLSDSIGPRKTVTFFLVIAAIGSLLFGLAPTIGMAFAGRVMVGFGVSMVFIPTMKILSQWYRKDEFAQMAGILNAVGGVGVLMATWALASMAASLGWRLSFEIIGLLTFFIAIFAWLLVRDQPPDTQRVGIDSAIDPVEDLYSSFGKSSLLSGAWLVISERNFWPLAIWFFFNCGIFFSFGGLWSGPYLMHVIGMSRAEAGSILSMIAWGMIIGSPLLGILSDRILKSRKKMFILCSSVLSLLFGLLFFFPDGFSKSSLYCIFFLFSVSSSAIVIIGFTSAKELFPIEIAGTSVGTVNLFPFLGGAVFMPLLGKILDAYPKNSTGGHSQEGYSALLFFLFISALVALLASFFIKETYGHTRQD